MQKRGRPRRGELIISGPGLELLGRSGSGYHPSSTVCGGNAQGSRVMKIDGRCHCGHVTFEAEADPETTTICNCTDCQTMSGAPLRAVISTRPGTFVLLSGKPTEYRKIADSGNVGLQGFCPQCGTALYATSIDDEPKAYNVRLGGAAPTKGIGAAPADICSLATGVGQRPQLNSEIRGAAALTPAKALPSATRTKLLACGAGALSRASACGSTADRTMT
jgi:hypothetical protein